MKRFKSSRVVIEHNKDVCSTEIKITVTITWNYNGRKEIKVFELIEDNARLYYMTFFDDKIAKQFAKRLCEIYGKCIKHITPY